MLPTKFVCASNEAATFENPVPAPIFRKSFFADLADAATLTVGCTGFYDLFLNGEKITAGYLMPYIANPDDVVFYNHYDLSGKLNVGENVLCVILGNGHANPIGGALWGHSKRNHAAPAFALKCVWGNTSFEACDMVWNRSHILFDDYRCGCYCDMTLYEKAWYLPGYDDVGWNKPQACDYSHSSKKLTTCESVDETRRIKPVKFFPGSMHAYHVRPGLNIYSGETIMGITPRFGGYIYDFGENCAGVPCLKIKGKKGQKIQMQFCECRYEGFLDNLNMNTLPDGCCQKDVYICSGEGIEEFIPPFTYHGFRYCYIYGITPEQATEDLLTYVVLHNNVKRKATFRCSDEISNEIFDACVRSDLANTFYMITDCPTREKNGWTGDAAVSAEHFMFLYGMEKVFADWIHCLKLAQNQTGALPVIVPSSGEFRHFIVWDSALYSLPYQVYKYTGDTKIITDNADAMMKNLRLHLSLLDERGLTENGYGDWLPVGSPADVYASPLGFCASCALLSCLATTKKMFEAVGLTENLAFLQQSHAKLRNAIRDEYNENGIITIGKAEQYRQPSYRICQTSQAIGLACGIFEESEKQTAVDTLVSLITQSKNSFDCGFLGLRAIFHVLTAYGHSDLAYKMITKPSFPSYANMIFRGETSICERFAVPGKAIGSRNHHFMADVSSWYLKAVAGIHVNPACNNPDRVVINPHFIQALESAQGSYTNDHGSVSVRWARETEKIHVTIEVAGNLDVVLGENLKADACIVSYNKQ
ncbi:MAG: family 78 glycoside hydrolase catalytic domain [Oscillospiraceae bacterium]|nr:family 78 glycoside hydrolase catalytic domain [Oscillospiraceae bacterium]